MAELVYAFDLKSNGEIRAGSIPAPGTKRNEWTKISSLIFCSEWARCHSQRSWRRTKPASHQKRSSRGRYLRRHASASILSLYQIQGKMSMMQPLPVIIISRLIPVLTLACANRNRRTLFARACLILDMSTMILGDCLMAFFRLCSSEFERAAFGDLISNSTSSSKMSAVLRFASGKNSTLCPASARISATRNSCGQGLRPAGIIIWPVFVDFSMPPL